MAYNTSLSSRERILRVLQRREVDRLPRDFEAEQPVVEGLLAHCGLPDGESLRRHLQADIHKVGMAYHCPYADSYAAY